MIYGNVNGYVYTHAGMLELIDTGRFTADEFFPISKYYAVYERENGEEWKFSVAYCTKKDAYENGRRMESAHATDIAEGLIPGCYTYEYEVREVTL